MIVLKMYGGLAGQMFQYSLGKYLSLTNNTKLYLDTTWYSKEKNSKFVRNFSLDKLNVAYEAFDKKSILWWKLKASSKLDRFNFLGFQHIKESDFSKFDPAILSLGNNIVLDGYWNSHKYFESIKDILQMELRPKEEPNAQNKDLLEKIRAVNSISLHFRRGDYALTSFHGMLSKEYYTAAIETMVQSVPDPYLFIFSDEPEWVLTNMEFNLPYEIVSFNRDEKNYWDMELMKNCKHNIIANSGFSWWAAWLNDNDHKKVVAPRNWVNAEKASFDNMPEEWLIL